MAHADAAAAGAAAGGSTVKVAQSAVSVDLVEIVTDTEDDPYGHDLDAFDVLAHPDVAFPGSDAMWFGAYDKATGDVVWEMERPGGTTAAPMSYMVDQKQYIVVTVGWDDMPSEYVALALP